MTPVLSKRYVSPLTIGLAALINICMPLPANAQIDNKYGDPQEVAIGKITAYDGRNITVNGKDRLHITGDTVVCVDGKKYHSRTEVDNLVKQMKNIDVAIVVLPEINPNYKTYKDVALRIDPGSLRMAHFQPQFPPCN